MPYGTVKVDTVTFTNGGSDQSVTFSGLYSSTTNNLNVTGTVSGATVIGSTLVSGLTVTGDTGSFTRITGGTAGFTTITGTTVTGTTAQFVSVTGGSAGFTTVTGTTVTGTTANFATVSGSAITGGTAGFTTITGTTVTGTTANFTTVSGATVTGNAGAFTSFTGITITGDTAGFTTVTGTTVTGTTANFVTVSGTTLTGNSHRDSAGNLRAIPQNSQTIGYTLVTGDVGKHVFTTTGVTIPSGVFVVGDAVSIYNNTTGNITITQGTNVTLRQAGSSGTGNRTLAQRGLATVLCVSGSAGTEFVIAGAGLS